MREKETRYQTNYFLETFGRFFFPSGIVEFTLTTWWIYVANFFIHFYARSSWALFLSFSSIFFFVKVSNEFSKQQLFTTTMILSFTGCWCIDIIITTDSDELILSLYEFRAVVFVLSIAFCVHLLLCFEQFIFTKKRTTTRELPHVESLRFRILLCSLDHVSAEQFSSQSVSLSLLCVSRSFVYSQQFF